MKKNNVKAFTLVEMLIVIVIIGILIASLMPRMQSAQGRARDVARKNDLAQIQTAIITSQQDRGAYPGMTGNLAKTGLNATWVGGANEGLTPKQMSDNLLKAGMSSIPTDPNGSNEVLWLGTNYQNTWAEWWQYVYMVGKRNWVQNGGFVLMARTEVEWSSNRVVCDSGSETRDITHWFITSTDDLSQIHLCTSVIQWTECKTNPDDWKCTYTENGQLRYILMY